MLYALIYETTIVQVADQPFEVAEPAHWVSCPDGCQPYLWRYEGGQCLPPLPPTPTELQRAAVGAVQGALDAQARALGYDGILSLCSYAGSGHPQFAAEGQAALVWRDAAWAALYAYQAQVQSGEQPAPTTVAEAIAAAVACLPAMQKPGELPVAP